MNTINQSAKQSLISIDHGQTERIQKRNHAKLSLVVSRGTAWVTVSGDPVDYLLRAGERLVIEDSKKDLVIESMSAHVEVQVLVA